MESVFWNIIFSSKFLEQFIAKWLLFTLIGIAFLITFKAGFINLGISAQLIGAAIIACYIVYWTENIYFTFFITLALASLLGIIPIFLKHYFKANEILTTLFLTFIAIPIGQFIMRPKGSELIVATPSVPKNIVPEILFWGSYVSPFHWIALLLIPFTWVYLNPSILGYKIRLLRSNPKILKNKEQLLVLIFSSIASSLCILFVVFADIVSVKGRYIAGDYDSLGFIGVVVALVALEKIILIPIAALIIAGIEMSFLLLKVSYGIPQAGALALYGIGLLIAAFFISKRGNGES